MAKFQLFRKKTFFLGYFFAKVRNSGLQPYTVREKEQFCKSFSGIFKILEHSFLSNLFKKSTCSGVFSSAVGCRIYWISCIKKELYYSLFFWTFPKVFGAAISKYPHKIICDGV